jgi:antirestriction protein ArdC
MRTDLYQSITQQIIDAIEAGASAATYQLPWHCNAETSTPINAISRRRYRGVNTLLLWAAAGQAGYPTGEWATYRQWDAAGAQVRKGERATVVLLWKAVGSGDDDAESDAARLQHRTLARAFYVFNVAQVDGHHSRRTELPAAVRNEQADAFFAAQPAVVWHGSETAFFDPASDTVSIPSFTTFFSPDAYYSVYAHELTHWTGAKPRLSRDLSGRFGSEAYAMEELVAELGAAFTLAHLGLAATPRDDHACYIASWLSVLRGDSRAIVTAAGRAQSAADYLVALADPTPSSPSGQCDVTSSEGRHEHRTTPPPLQIEDRCVRALPAATLASGTPPSGSAVRCRHFRTVSVRT